MKLLGFLRRVTLSFVISGLFCKWIAPDFLGFAWAETWLAFGVCVVFLLTLFYLKEDNSYREFSTPTFDKLKKDIP